MYEGRGTDSTRDTIECARTHICCETSLTEEMDRDTHGHPATDSENDSPLTGAAADIQPSPVARAQNCQTKRVTNGMHGPRSTVGAEHVVHTTLSLTLSPRLSCLSSTLFTRHLARHERAVVVVVECEARTATADRRSEPEAHWPPRERASPPRPWPRPRRVIYRVVRVSLRRTVDPEMYGEVAGAVCRHSRHEQS